MNDTSAQGGQAADKGITEAIASGEQIIDQGGTNATTQLPDDTQRDAAQTVGDDDAIKA